MLTNGAINIIAPAITPMKELKIKAFFLPKRSASMPPTRAPIVPPMRKLETVNNHIVSKSSFPIVAL